VRCTPFIVVGLALLARRSRSLLLLKCVITAYLHPSCRPVDAESL